MYYDKIKVVFRFTPKNTRIRQTNRTALIFFSNLCIQLKKKPLSDYTKELYLRGNLTDLLTYQFYLRSRLSQVKRNCTKFCKYRNLCAHIFHDIIKYSIDAQREQFQYSHILKVKTNSRKSTFILLISYYLTFF